MAASSPFVAFMDPPPAAPVSLSRKRKLLSLLLVVMVIAILVAVLSVSTQRSYQPVSLSTKHTQIQREFSHDLSLELKTLPCLNGITPKHAALLTPEEKLKLFKQSPCHPVILVPGLMASRLMVEIDCEKLQEEDPDTFEACGWTTCDIPIQDGDFQPNEEYNFWMPDLLGDLSFIGGKACWERLSTLDFNPQEKGAKQFTSAPGVRISWYGDTRQTKKYDEAGLGGIQHVAPDEIPQQIEFLARNFRSFQYFSEALLAEGHVAGYTIGGMPYDWRLPVYATGVEKRLPRLIEDLHRSTGKRVVIIAHSMGNLNVLNALNQLEQRYKDMHIQKWISINAPWMGSVDSIETLISGTEMLDLGWFGFGRDAQKRMMGAWGGLYELIPKNTLQENENQAWYKELLSRLEMERTAAMSGDRHAEVTYWKNIYGQNKVPLAWYPTPLTPRTHMTEGDTSKAKSNTYRLLMRLWNKLPLVQVKERQFSAVRQDLQFMAIGGYIADPEFSHLILDLVMKTGVNQLKNPGVEVASLYSLDRATTSFCNYDANPGAVYDHFAPEPLPGRYMPLWPGTSSDVCRASKKDNEPGDGSVPLSSGIIAAMKWSWEYVNKQANAKPARMFEYCSQLSATTPEDMQYIKDLQKRDVYNVLPCECLSPDYDGPTAGGCGHRSMLYDRHLVEWVVGEAKSTLMDSVTPELADA
eukprot:GILJ01005905.1.p1 GENE.GILJ01005905.1~~GILJ01005905.1.p1  ORF type:complete len:710 (+),score=79.17 GILJ01005905.1:45-2132(+)